MRVRRELWLSFLWGFLWVFLAYSGLYSETQKLQDPRILELWNIFDELEILTKRLKEDNLKLQEKLEIAELSLEKTKTLFDAQRNEYEKAKKSFELWSETMESRLKEKTIEVWIWRVLFVSALVWGVFFPP